MFLSVCKISFRFSFRSARSQQRATNTNSTAAAMPDFLDDPSSTNRHPRAISPDSSSPGALPLLTGARPLQQALAGRRGRSTDGDNAINRSIRSPSNGEVYNLDAHELDHELDSSPSSDEDEDVWERQSVSEISTRAVGGGPIYAVTKQSGAFPMERLHESWHGGGEVGGGGEDEGRREGVFHGSWGRSMNGVSLCYSTVRQMAPRGRRPSMRGQGGSRASAFWGG